MKVYLSLMLWSISNYAKGVGDEERAGAAWGIFESQAQNWLTSYLLMSPGAEPCHMAPDCKGAWAAQEPMGAGRALWVSATFITCWPHD